MLGPDGRPVDGSWELNILVTDLQVEIRLRVKGDLHVGGVMLRLVETLGKNNGRGVNIDKTSIKHATLCQYRHTSMPVYVNKGMYQCLACQYVHAPLALCVSNYSFTPCHAGK